MLLCLYLEYIQNKKSYFKTISKNAETMTDGKTFPVPYREQNGYPSYERLVAIFNNRPKTKEHNQTFRLPFKKEHNFSCLNLLN